MGVLALQSKGHCFKPLLLQSFGWDCKLRSRLHDLIVGGTFSTHCTGGMVLSIKSSFTHLSAWLDIDVLKSKKFEPPHDKTSTMICAPSEDSDQPGHLPSLIKVFTVHMKKHCVLSYQLSALRRLRLIWVFAGHTCHFVGFVMRRLK